MCACSCLYICMSIICAFPYVICVRISMAHLDSCLYVCNCIRTCICIFIGRHRSWTLCPIEARLTDRFYFFSLDESLCVRQEVEVEGGQHGADYGQEESLLSQPISRSSSYLSLSKGGTAELEEDLVSLLQYGKYFLCVFEGIFSLCIWRHFQLCLSICLSVLANGVHFLQRGVVGDRGGPLRRLWILNVQVYSVFLGGMRKEKKWWFDRRERYC